MQSRDELDRLMSTDQGTLEELAIRAAELQEQGAVSHVIGVFPIKGQIVTINGLQFKIVKRSPKDGRLRLELVRP